MDAAKILQDSARLPISLKLTSSEPQHPPITHHPTPTQPPSHHQFANHPSVGSFECIAPTARIPVRAWSHGLRLDLWRERQRLTVGSREPLVDPERREILIFIICIPWEGWCIQAATLFSTLYVHIGLQQTPSLARSKLLDPSGCVGSWRQCIYLVDVLESTKNRPVNQPIYNECQPSCYSSSPHQFNIQSSHPLQTPSALLHSPEASFKSFPLLAAFSSIHSRSSIIASVRTHPPTSL